MRTAVLLLHLSANGDPHDPRLVLWRTRRPPTGSSSRSPTRCCCCAGLAADLRLRHRRARVPPGSAPLSRRPRGLDRGDRQLGHGRHGQLVVRPRWSSADGPAAFYMLRTSDDILGMRADGLDGRALRDLHHRPRRGRRRSGRRAGRPAPGIPHRGDRCPRALHRLRLRRTYFDFVGRRLPRQDGVAGLLRGSTATFRSRLRWRRCRDGEPDRARGDAAPPEPSSWLLAGSVSLLLVSLVATIPR